jgi:hypothetical protein
MKQNHLGNKADFAVIDEFSLPDISSYMDNGNPTLRSPTSTYELSLMQTKDSLNDIDFYSNFIHNAVMQFRKLRVYKNYKAYLMSLGLDHCQYLHNINSDMATLEMNHVVLTIFDVALMISEHIVNTTGHVSTCQIVAELRRVHTNNLVPLIIMSKTVHQLYHNEENFFVHPNQVFGRWVELLNTYKNGITPEICVKLLYYIRNAKNNSSSLDNNLLQVAETIKNWSEMTYGSHISFYDNQGYTSATGYGYIC